MVPMKSAGRPPLHLQGQTDRTELVISTVLFKSIEPERLPSENNTQRLQVERSRFPAPIFCNDVERDGVNNLSAPTTDPPIEKKTIAPVSNSGLHPQGNAVSLWLGNAACRC